MGTALALPVVMKPQACRLSTVWTIWIVFPATALALIVTRGWPIALLVTAVAVAAEVLYIRVFPALSGMLGYGSVDDVTAPPVRSAAAQHVTLYTALGCPFCPIVRHRLEQLQRDVPFDLDEQDITFRPQLLTARGIRSVPVIEVDGRYLVGNVTSDKLAAFLTN